MITFVDLYCHGVLTVAGGLWRLALPKPLSFHTDRIFLQTQVRCTPTDPSYQAVCVTCCAAARYVRHIGICVSAFFVRSIQRPTYSRGIKLPTQKLMELLYTCSGNELHCARGPCLGVGLAGPRTDPSDILHFASSSGPYPIPTSICDAS